MTLPSEYNAISMGQVRTELNKSSGPISLNDDDVRILFQVSRTPGTIITMHNGHGKSNIMPPVVTVPPLLAPPLSNITQTTATVTWKAYESLVVDGQVDNYQVQVYRISDNVKVHDSGNLPQSAYTHNITGNVIALIASSDHSSTGNYRVDVMAKNVSATKTSSLILLTLENVPLKPTLPVGTVLSSTQIRVDSSSTYATTYYIYKDGAVTPTFTVSSMPYTDTVGVYTSHTYTVKGHSTGGDGPMSDTSVSVRSLPDAPISAVFTTPSSTASSLTINWTLSTSPVVNYYQLVVVNFGTTTEVYRNNNITNTTTTITIPSMSATSKFTATLYTVNESSIFYNLPVSTSEDIWTLTVAPTVAPVVTKVTDTLLGQSELTVTWSENVTGHTSYSLVRYDVTTPGNAVVTLTNVTSPYTDTGLLSYNDYKYTLLSVNAGGSSLPSPVSNIVRTLPGPAKVVTSLAVTLANITNTTAKATWTIPSDIGQVSKFTVNLKQGATTLESKDVLSTDTSSTMGSSPWTTTMTANTSYAVSVTTTNDNNSITTTDVAFRTKFAAPSAPSVTSPATSQTALTITWGAITGATGYKLERTNETNSTVTELTGFTPSGTTTLSYTDSDCSSYNVYHYKLSVLNDGGYSVYSGVSNSVRTLPGPAVAATGVTISSITSSTAALSWTAATGQVTSYDIIVNGGTAVNVGNVTSTTLGQSPFTALSANTLYSVVIKTINENADTTNASTSAKTFTTITTKPSAPSVTQPATSTTQLEVTWTTNSATTYDLTRYNVTTGAAGVLLTNKSTPYTDTSLSAYNEYQYTVTSNNSASPAVGVTSDKSPTGKRTLPNNPVSVSSISISNVVASANTSNVRVNWVNGDWATQYGVVTKFDVSVKSSGGTEYGNANVSGSATYLDVSSIPNATTFTIVIKTYNSVGNASSSSSFVTPPTQPSAPYLDTGITPNPTQTKVSLKWTAVTGATGYTLKPFKADGTALTEVTAIGSNTVDYTATAKTEYYFKIVATNTGGSSLASPSSSNITTLADKVAAPSTGMTATAKANTIHVIVSWDAVTGADSYKVYREPGAGGTRTDLGTQVSGFTDTTTSENTAYKYFVSSVTTGGESVVSSAIGPVTTNYAAPGAPTGFTKSGISSSGFTVSWTAPATGVVSQYYVEVTYPDSSKLGRFVDSPSTTTTFNVFSGNLTYSVSIDARNNGGKSTALTGTVLTAPNTPSTPTGTVSGSNMSVSWTVVSGLTYNIYRNGTAAGNQIATGKTSSPYSDTGVSAGSSYVYYVEAVNTSGVAMSAGSTSTTMPTVPGAPTIGTATYKSISIPTAKVTATVNWTAPSSNGGSAITGYKITSSNGETATAGAGATSADILIATATECTFTVKATNAIGDSTASSASGIVCAILPPVLTAPTLEPTGNQLRVSIAAADSATSWQIRNAVDSTWPTIDTTGSWFDYSSKTSAVTVNIGSTTTWNFSAFQKRVINGTTYYSGPAYATGTIIVTSISNKTYDYASQSTITSADYVIPGSVITIHQACGGAGGGGGSGGVTSLVKGGNGGSTLWAASTHTVPAGVRQIAWAIGAGGVGGRNKAVYPASPNSYNIWTDPGDGYASGGWGGACGKASTSSGYGGGGGGSTAIWWLDANGAWVSDLMICGGGGGGGGGLGGNAGNNSTTVTTVTTDANVVILQGTDGYAADPVTSPTSQAGGGGGGGGSGGAGGASSTAAGTGGKFWRNPTTTTAWTAPVTANTGATGGAGGLTTDAVGTVAPSGGNGWIIISYKTYVPSNLKLGQ